jgi:hypothetical protein
MGMKAIHTYYRNFMVSHGMNPEGDSGNEDSGEGDDDSNDSSSNISSSSASNSGILPPGSDIQHRIWNYLWPLIAKYLTWQFWVNIAVVFFMAYFIQMLNDWIVEFKDWAEE